MKGAVVAMQWQMGMRMRRSNGSIAPRSFVDGNRTVEAIVSGPGVFLYYPERRQVLPKLRAFIEHVKYQRADRAHVDANARGIRKLRGANGS